MRDRLIELIRQAKTEITTYAREGEPVTKWRRNIVDRAEANQLADHLISNGVILPPCKVGDSIFRCCEERNEIWEWLIAMMIIHPEEIIYVDDSENEFSVDDIGKTVFLTKEEAEKALKEREGNGNERN